MPETFLPREATGERMGDEPQVDYFPRRDMRLNWLSVTTIRLFWRYGARWRLHR